jgi:protein-disulfide isomerase
MKKIIGLGVVAVVIIFGLYSWNRPVPVQPKDTAVPKEAVITPMPSSNENVATETPTLGDLQAPVTIVEYGHFQCPYCNRFFRETEPQIDAQYIQTGKVKFIWKDFAFEGVDSKRASQAAYCAKDQGKFWEYRTALFRYIWDNFFSKGINGEEASVFPLSTLQKLATDMGLDSETFNVCLSAGKYAERVDKNFAEGVAQGVKGTPTIFINGQKVVGAQPFAVYSQIIENELKK